MSPQVCAAQKPPELACGDSRKKNGKKYIGEGGWGSRSEKLVFRKTLENPEGEKRKKEDLAIFGGCGRARERSEKYQMAGCKQ